MSTRSEKRFTKKERSWILYDWANSVYATNIMAAIFPTIFVSIAGDMGDIWWGYGTSIATLVIALLAPFLGSIADYRGMKKKLFTGFMLLGVIATALIALSSDWRFMLAAYVLSKIGFSGSNLFYDSFLTDVTTDERMDRVSAWGYAMGYIGGSTIPFVTSIAVLMALGYSSPVAQKFSILITSVWWILFTIPFLKNVEQEHYIKKPEKISLKDALLNVLNTAKDISKSRGMLLFIIAYFFYIDGVGTVISISTAYGTALGLGATGMILALLVTQIVAMPCSILFGKLTKKISARKALLIAIAVYMFICLVGFYMGFSLEPHQEKYNQVFNESRGAWEAKLDNYAFENRNEAKKALDGYLNAVQTALRAKDTQAFDELTIRYPQGTQTEQNELALIQAMLKPELMAFRESNEGIIRNYQNAIAFSTTLFWAMAVMVGTMQGGIQAVSRSYFGKLVPKKRSNEYFGFFDIFGKFATVIGPLLYALVGGVTKRSSFGALVLILLFLIGFLVLLFAKQPLKKLEEQQALSE